MIVEGKILSQVEIDPIAVLRQLMTSETKGVAKIYERCGKYYKDTYDNEVEITEEIYKYLTSLQYVIEHLETQRVTAVYPKYKSKDKRPTPPLPDLSNTPVVSTPNPYQSGPDNPYKRTYSPKTTDPQYPWTFKETEDRIETTQSTTDSPVEELAKLKEILDSDPVNK